MTMLPLFPLEAVLFPGTPMPLHIFEPRYREMIEACLETDEPFGVVLIRRGLEAFGPLAEPHLVGCTARIVENQTLPDGRMNIVVLGEMRFRILDLDRSGSYLRGEVEMMPLELTGLPRTGEQPAALLARRVQRYLELLRAITNATIEVDEMQLPVEPLLLMYFSAAILQIPSPEKQSLLAAEDAGEMLAMLNRIYPREIDLLARTSKISPNAAERLARLN